MHAASVIDARAPAAPLKSSLANRRHPRRRPAVVARGRAFDDNDPLTWNANADDDAGMDFDSTEDVGVANLQELSDADLAALVGAAGATVPQMIDDAAFASLREEQEKERMANTAGECITDGQREYAAGDYEKALATFARAATLAGSGPVRYRKSVVAPAGPSAGFKPRELSAGEEIAIRYNTACCHAKLCNVSEGLASLNAALERGYDEYPAIRKDEDISILRQDPRFERIMARFEPQGAVGKIFDAFNGPKRGVSLLDGIKDIFSK